MRLSSLFVLTAIVIGSFLSAQAAPQASEGWTDKNNTERHAEFMLSLAYSEAGYCLARVEMKLVGSTHQFTVSPGKRCRLGRIVIDNSKSIPPDKLMQDGPRTGDVFSAARINEWMENLRKRYVGKTGPLASVSWGWELGPDDPSEVLIVVQVRERN